MNIKNQETHKLKQESIDYKQQAKNTISAQQDTIKNYHNQLTQSKEKYDILYNDNLDKNNIIQQLIQENDQNTERNASIQIENDGLRDQMDNINKDNMKLLQEVTQYQQKLVDV